MYTNLIDQRECRVFLNSVSPPAINTIKRELTPDNWYFLYEAVVISFMLPFHGTVSWDILSMLCGVRAWSPLCVTPSIRSKWDESTSLPSSSASKWSLVHPIYLSEDIIDALHCTNMHVYMFIKFILSSCLHFMWLCMLVWKTKYLRTGSNRHFTVFFSFHVVFFILLFYLYSIPLIFTCIQFYSIHFFIIPIPQWKIFK